MGHPDGKIGDRIREIRKTEKLSQEGFAAQLGIKRGYISTLEIHKSEPSEQLILNMCRTFGISYNWLKHGQGDKHIGRLYSGDIILKEIVKEIESPERMISIMELAVILGIDPYRPQNRLNLPKDFYEAINLFIRIFRQGDPDKIKAILAQLRAFLPREDRGIIGVILKDDHS